jgi:hypothetical protein
MLTQAGITTTTTQLEINIYLSLWCLFTAIFPCGQDWLKKFWGGNIHRLHGFLVPSRSFH